jgi:hypothetical protein
MGHDGKYGLVTTEHGNIPDDEPVIVIRARDKNACPAISAYHDLCERNGQPAVPPRADRAGVHAVRGLAGSPP